MSDRTHIVMTILVASTATLLFNGCDMLKPADNAAKSSQTIENKEVVENKASSEKKTPEDVVAQVGDWVLTKSELNERMALLKEGLPNFDDTKPGVKEQVVNELIRQQLLVQDAASRGLGDKKEIRDAVEDFRRSLLVQELAVVLTKEVAATEKEAKDYYDQNKALMADPVLWKVRVIRADDEAAAKGILVQVLQGEDFAALAKAQSKDKSAANGGLLPEFSQAPFAELGIAIGALETGGTSGVFKGPNGFYIARVDSKKGGSPKSFDAVKKDLIAGLTMQKQQNAILDHIDELAKKTSVTVNKEALGSGSK